MTSRDLQLLAEKMLSDDPELRDETILVLHEKMGEYDDFADIIIQTLHKLIHCNKETQADVLKELPMLLYSDVGRVLIPFLSSPFFEIRGLATALLYESPLEHGEIETLRDLLRHKDEDVRSRAVELLVAGGHDELVSDENNYYRHRKHIKKKQLYWTFICIYSDGKVVSSQCSVVSNRITLCNY